MKIVIVGAGKVGIELIKYLSKEFDSVTVIDNNQKVIEDIEHVYDIQVLFGNGFSSNVLKEANINTVDVFIAVSESDEINVLSSLLAKKLGAKHTIARVRNPEYLSQHDFLSQDLGIDFIINPELEAAKEIAKMLRHPSANHVEFFADNKAEIIEITLNPSSILIGRSLSDIKSTYNLKFLVSAVERDGEVTIPNGSYVLKENDKICITGAIDDIEILYKKLRINKDRPKKIMVIGGGKIAYYLAKELEKINIQLKIIESNRDRCLELSRELPHASIIHGDGTVHDVLFEERIDEMDAVVTLTGFDEENMIISLFSKTLNINKIITKVNRYLYSDIFQSVDLGSIISPKMITSNLVIRYVRTLSKSFSHVRSLYKLINNQIEVAEFLITSSNAYTDIAFKDLKFKPNILVICIIRDGVVIMPEGSDVMKENDSVIMLSNNVPLKNIKNAILK